MNSESTMKYNESTMQDYESTVTDENVISLKINKRIFNEKFYPELFNYYTRWNVYYGSAGSGKSHFIAQKLIIKAMQSKRRILVARRFGTSLRNSVYQLIIDVLKDFQLFSHCRVKESSLYIQLPTESEFLFIGLDNEEKLLSLQDISDVWIEEATEASQDMLEQLSLRMRGKAENHQIHISFNPVSTLNYLYNFVNVNPPKSIRMNHSTFKDNTFLPPSYVEALNDLYRTNPKKAKVYCDGEWGVAGQLVYENYRIEEFNHLNLLPNRAMEVRFGGDFGFTLDPTAIVFTIYDKINNTIYVVDEIYKRGLTNPELAKILREQHWNKQTIYFDSSDPKSIMELRRMRVIAKPAKKGKDSIKYGIAFINRHKLIVHPRCESFILELKDYQYQKDKYTGQYVMDRLEGADHAMDALRYAYAEYYSSGKFKSLKKETLGL